MAGGSIGIGLYKNTGPVYLLCTPNIGTVCIYNIGGGIGLYLHLQIAQKTAQYRTRRENRQYIVQYFGAILPILSVLRWAIVLGILEVQVDHNLL